MRSPRSPSCNLVTTSGAFKPPTPHGKKGLALGRIDASPPRPEPLLAQSQHSGPTRPTVRCVVYIHSFPYNVTDARSSSSSRAGRAACAPGASDLIPTHFRTSYGLLGHVPEAAGARGGGQRPGPHSYCDGYTAGWHLDPSFWSASKVSHGVEVYLNIRLLKNSSSATARDNRGQAQDKPRTSISSPGQAQDKPRTSSKRAEPSARASASASAVRSLWPSGLIWPSRPLSHHGGRLRVQGPYPDPNASPKPTLTLTKSPYARSRP